MGKVGGGGGVYSESATSSQHRDVHPAEVTPPGTVESQARTPSRGMQRRLSATVQTRTQLRLAGQFPSAPHPLGASVQRLPSRARSRWGSSREGGERGSVRHKHSTKLEHERLKLLLAAPAS